MYQFKPQMSGLVAQRYWQKHCNHQSPIVKGSENRKNLGQIYKL